MINLEISQSPSNKIFNSVATLAADIQHDFKIYFPEIFYDVKDIYDFTYFLIDGKS